MIRDLKIWQKLMLIAAAFALPIIVLLYLLVAQLNKEVDLAQREKNGIEYILTARKLLKDTQQHRGMSVAFLSGDASFREPMLARQADIAADLRALETVDQKFGADLKTTDNFNALKQKWQEIQSKVLTMKPEESFDAHVQLIGNDLVPLIVKVRDASNLTMDPDLDSSYMVDIFTGRLPELNEILGQARARGALAATRKSLTPAERQQLTFLLGRARISLDNLNSSVQVVFRMNPQLEPTLKPAIQQSTTLTNEYLNVLDKKLVSAADVEITAQEYFAAATKAIDANFEFGDNLQVVLDSDLQQGLTQANQGRLVALGLTALILGLAVALILFIARTITRPIMQLSQVADRISLGELDAKIDIRSKDEIGELAEAVGRMQASLQAAIERLRARRAAA